MATKEDILEQIVEEYLINEGYFVQHNIKFLPRTDHPDYVQNLDSNHSDIDVLGYHPKKTGPKKVMAVSCKSWQSGFIPASYLDKIKHNKKIAGREAWKSFRELTSPKWSQGFCDAVYAATCEKSFTYVLAVSHCKGDATLWEQEPGFRQALNGNPIMVLSFSRMVERIGDGLGTTLAATEVGRLLQMFNAAKIDIKLQNK